jgi:hypothetical protein
MCECYYCRKKSHNVPAWEYRVIGLSGILACMCLIMIHTL